METSKTCEACNIAHLGGTCRKPYCHKVSVGRMVVMNLVIQIILRNMDVHFEAQVIYFL